jgi:hypothetical protein
MKRLISLCIVLTAIALISSSAFAEVQNVKVSGDIEVMGIYRDELDLVKGSSSNEQEAWYQSVVRVRIDADLTDNVSTTVRLLNERDWDVETSTDTNVDLDLASITMKEMFYAPLSLTIGRQELKYGTGMIIGDVDRNAASTETDITAVNYSARKSFDAIKAVIDYDPLVVDIFTAKIDETNASTSARDTDLYGIDASYALGTYDATAAGYLVLKKADLTEEEVYTLGLRSALTPMEALNVAGEIAFQFGDYTSTRDQSAWALDLDAAYSLDVAMNPVVGLSYSFRSGAKAGAAGDQEAWLPLYEDQTKGRIADYIFDGRNNGVNSNCHIINAKASIVPVEDLTASIDYYHYILDEKLVANSGENHPFSLPLGKKVMNRKTHLGDELDLSLIYDYTEDVRFCLVGSWFLPGDAFDDWNNDRATEVVGSVAVAF